MNKNGIKLPTDKASQTIKKKTTNSGWSPFCDTMAILVKGDNYFFKEGTDNL